MPIKIRKFRSCDIDRITEIEKDSFPAGAYTKRRLTNLARNHPNDFLLAEVAGKIAAYLIVCQRSKVADLASLAVDKPYRDSGIGKSLVNFVLNKSKKKGLKKASLEVRTDNQKAISFFEDLDFKIVKVLKKYHRDGTDAYRMEKALN